VHPGERRQRGIEGVDRAKLRAVDVVVLKDASAEPGLRFALRSEPPASRTAAASGKTSAAVPRTSPWRNRG
jgi:hypothetical protein